LFLFCSRFVPQKKNRTRTKQEQNQNRKQNMNRKRTERERNKNKPHPKKLAVLLNIYMPLKYTDQKTKQVYNITKNRTIQ
jgi:hypothetical protein